VVFGLVKLRMLIEKIHEDVGHFGEMQTFAKVNDVPPSSLLDPKRVQLCQNCGIVGTWCRSQLLATLERGKKGVLQASGLN